MVQDVSYPIGRFSRFLRNRDESERLHRLEENFVDFLMGNFRNQEQRGNGIAAAS